MRNRNTRPKTYKKPSSKAVAAAQRKTPFPPVGTTLSTYRGSDATRRRVPKSPPPKPRWRIRSKKIFITLLIIGLLAGGYVGTKALLNISKSLGGNLFGLLSHDKLLGEDVGRVNILLAGNSADDVGHNGGDLTDSIMILSIDTENKRAFMMSLPRDLWVEIPDNGYSKINSVYVYGKADNFSESGYPAGGMGLLEKVVETNLDIDINYYALVNYTALRDAVNAVGGVDVQIQSNDPRGLYDPSRDWTKSYRAPLVKLPNGVNHLDGQEALNLARARGDSYGSYGYGLADFTRTENQRLLLASLKKKSTSAGVIANPIRVGQLFDSFGNNVVTDLKTNEVRRLYELVKQVPDDQIVSVSLNDADGENLLTSYRTYNGQSALVPAAGVDDYTEINAFIAKLFTPPPATEPQGQ